MERGARRRESVGEPDGGGSSANVSSPARLPPPPRLRGSRLAGLTKNMRYLTWELIRDYWLLESIRMGGAFESAEPALRERRMGNPRTQGSSRPEDRSPASYNVRKACLVRAMADPVPLDSSGPVIIPAEGVTKSER